MSLSTYDPATGNLLLTIADASGFKAQTTFTYNGVGLVLSATDPLGVVTQFTYDSHGNQTSVTRDAGTGRLNQLTQMGYSAVGDVVSVTDPRGNITTSTYDAGRRVTSTTLPANAAGAALSTAFLYDADGNLLQTQQSSGGGVLTSVSSTYTLTGQVATATDARGNVTRFSYDAVDRLSSVSDPVGNVTIYGYDALGRQTSVSNAAISGTPLLQTAYTPDGLTASLTDANSNTTNLSYDGFDRLSVTTYPDSSTETLSYDGNSNVVSRITRKGDTISYAYDTLNRLCTKTVAGSLVACGVTGANTTNYAYDLVGRVIAVNDSGASMAAVSGGNASYATSASYDAVNLPLRSEWTSPVTPTAPGTAASVTFDHGYDANDRRIRQAANDNSWLEYPGGASSTSYTANNLNQYSGVGGATPTYDGNGNLTFDGTLSYCYDDESRLTRILSAGTCASPTTTIATYAYDAQGRRKSKTVGGVTTNFVTDADNREVLEYDGSGAVVRWYAYGQGPNEVLGQMNIAGGTRDTKLPDIQGSVIASLSSGGTLTKTDYEPFGENASLSSDGFNYTAQRLDAETAGSASQPRGLYYYRARIYSPTWGRFLQADPSSGSGTNLYAYVGNDPLNLLDPQGLAAERPSNTTSNSVQAGMPLPTPGIVFSSLMTFGDMVGEIAGNQADYWKLGKSGESQAANMLRTEGHDIIDTQVYVRTSQGLRIVDFITQAPHARPGTYEGFEVKVNTSQRTPAQIAKDNLIERVGGVVVSRSSPLFGQILKFGTGEVRILVRPPLP